jgi:hypothetical protein
MDYQIALAPDLQISPEEFVAAWNTGPDRPTGAEARLEAAGATGYDSLLEAIIIGVTTELTTHYLIDKVTSLLQHRRPGRRITVLEMEPPDGPRLLVATIEEE